LRQVGTPEKVSKEKHGDSWVPKKPSRNHQASYLESYQGTVKFTDSSVTWRWTHRVNGTLEETPVKSINRKIAPTPAEVQLIDAQPARDPRAPLACVPLVMAVSAKRQRLIARAEM